MENSKAKLFKKMVEVLKEVETIKKSGRNNHLGFDYSLESDIIEGIRKGLIKHNLFAFTSVEEVNKVEQLTTCKLKTTFVDSETGEEYSVFSYGYGQDSRDFGLGKSVTNAFKMMWTKNFLLKGELMDIENDEETPVRVNKPTPQPKPTPKQEVKPEAKEQPKPTETKSSWGKKVDTTTTKPTGFGSKTASAPPKQEPVRPDPKDLTPTEEDIDLP